MAKQDKEVSRARKQAVREGVELFLDQFKFNLRVELDPATAENSVANGVIIQADLSAVAGGSITQKGRRFIRFGLYFTDGRSLSFTIQSPGSKELKAQTYKGAVAADKLFSGDNVTPGIALVVNGRSSERMFGSFIISEIGFSPTDGVVSHLELTLYVAEGSPEASKSRVYLYWHRKGARADVKNRPYVRKSEQFDGTLAGSARLQQQKRQS